MTAAVQAREASQVGGAFASERDLAVLRSFARRIDPSDAGAHNNLGVLYYNKGMYEEAVGAFMRALELDSRMQVAQRNLEIAYIHSGAAVSRVEQLREHLRTNPSGDARKFIDWALTPDGQKIVTEVGYFPVK